MAIKKQSVPGQQPLAQLIEKKLLPVLVWTKDIGQQRYQLHYKLVEATIEG